MRCLIIAEHADGALKASTYSSITAAAALGTEVDVLVVGHRCDTVAVEAATITGVTKVLVAQAPEYEKQLAELVVPIVHGLASSYTHIITDATTTGRNLLPRISASLDVGMMSDVVEILSHDTFKRPIYAGNALATIQSLDSIKVLTVRSSAFSAATGRANASPVEQVTSTGRFDSVRFVSEAFTVSERPELTTAKVVVSGGRGLKSKENFVLLERVADKLGGAVGASRAAVDSGFAANDLQVGQTGKIVAPELYIAVGISGAIQHLAGMSGSKVIVAINQDPDAPIGQVADYLLVADLFEALPELDRAL